MSFYLNSTQYTKIAQQPPTIVLALLFTSTAD